jgi:hypothetical protein
MVGCKTKEQWQIIHTHINALYKENWERIRNHYSEGEIYFDENCMLILHA